VESDEEEEPVKPKKSTKKRRNRLMKTNLIPQSKNPKKRLALKNGITRKLLNG